MIASKTHYACDGGRATCANNVRFRRDQAEEALLAGIRRELAAPAVAREFERRVRQQLRELSRAPPVDVQRIAQLEAQINNLLDAMQAHGLTSSASLAERLRRTEAELTGLKAEQAAADLAVVERLLPDLTAHFQRQIERLPELLTTDVVKAREILRTHIGPLTVEVSEREFQFLRETGHAEAALLRAASGGLARTASNVGSGGRI